LEDEVRCLQRFVTENKTKARSVPRVTAKAAERLKITIIFSGVYGCGGRMGDLMFLLKSSGSF